MVLEPPCRMKRAVSGSSQTTGFPFRPHLERDAGDEVEFPIVWDLKGSMVGRNNGVESANQKDWGSPQLRMNTHEHSDLVMWATQAHESAGEDKDWLQQSRDLALPDSQRAAILQTLEGEPGLSMTESKSAKDSKLLVRSRLIDYSLIVGRLVYELEPCQEGSSLGSQLDRALG